MGKLTFTQRKPLRNSAHGRKGGDTSPGAEGSRRRVQGVKGEILGEAKPREAADRDWRNCHARLTDSQREQNPKAERGVRRAEQFDRDTPRNGTRVMAVGGPKNPAAVRLSARKRKPVGPR
jgi:hypothetical protein